MRRLLISGYKSHELGIYKNDHPGVNIIKIAIEKQLRGLLEDGLLEWVIISGLKGVEQWAADVVFDLQMDFPELQLAVITPFLEMDKNWSEEAQEQFQMLLEQADFTSSVTQKPYVAPWQFKAANQFLLDNTDGLLLVYDEEKEGSPKFLKEAASERVSRGEYQLVTIGMYDIQVIAEEEQEKLREDW